MYMLESTFLQTAIRLARLGFRVHPVAPGGKHPLVPGWPDAATTDEGQILEWARRYPRANAGVVTGKGLNVIDIDSKHGVDGFASLACLEDELGQLPSTYSVDTPGGGRHLYFATHPDVVIRNSAGRLGLGVDDRGHHGYVVGEGSVVNGRSYALHGSCRTITPLPQLWVERLLVLQEKPTERRRPGVPFVPGRTGGTTPEHGLHSNASSTSSGSPNQGIATGRSTGPPTALAN
jgi:hypothetical protein